jgi:hypothetical protein
VRDFLAIVNRPISPDMTLDWTEEETVALAEHLRHAIDEDRYLLSLRLSILRDPRKARSAGAAARAAAAAETGRRAATSPAQTAMSRSDDR